MSTLESAEKQAHQAAALAFLEKHYDTETVCPYCGSQAGGRMGCCGESCDHFEEQYIDDDGEPIDIDEYIENFDPVKEQAKYEAVMSRSSKK